ncbi:MAG: ubiquinol-cytochrome c reductase iron-sulfur subunit [Nitrospirota bacterium]|nr:ubiquinol-cytochrome c reductase iron-sulfur subunit [Nitrospirota bacterium]
MNHPEQQDPVTEGRDELAGSRRTFFKRVTGAAVAFIGMGLAIPLVGYLVSPAFKRRDQTWVEVGDVADLPVGEPKQLDYLQAVQDGWLTTKLHKAVWAVQQADGQVTVFSPLCTHLGCGYRWDDPDKRFTCPCHGSVYDLAGKVLGGPAPRRLDVLPSKVEHGKLFVIYKEFKAGLPNSVEL